MGVSLGIDLGSATITAAALVDGRLTVVPSRASGLASVSPLDESALTALLGRVVADAAAHLGAPVDSVSAVVAGGMGHDQRRVVARALRSQQGALRVYRTLAAAAGAVARLDVGRVVLIIDVGAGSMEAAVVGVGGGVAECHAVGHRRMGGDDVDRVLADRLAEMVRVRLGPATHLDPAAQARIRAAAELARRDLSTSQRVAVPLFGLQAARSEPADGVYELTRADIAPLVGYLVDHCRQLVRRVLDEAGSPAVDAVVAVGGVSRTPALRHMLTAETGVAPVAGVDPDTFVAGGASLRNGVLEGTLAEPLVVDVLPCDLRLRLDGGRWTTVVPRNTALPAGATITLAPGSGAEAAVAVRIHEDGQWTGADDPVVAGSVPSAGSAGAAEPADGVTVTLEVGVDESLDLTLGDGGTVGDDLGDGDGDGALPVGADVEAGIPERRASVGVEGGAPAAAPAATPAVPLAGAPGMAGPDWSRLGRGGGRRTLGWVGAVVAVLGALFSFATTRADTADQGRSAEFAAAPTTRTSSTRANSTGTSSTRTSTTNLFPTTGFTGGLGGVVTTLPPTIAGGARPTVWYDLRKGDCIQSLPPVEGIEKLAVVGCDTAHAAQVYDVDLSGLLPKIDGSAFGITTASTTGGPGGVCYDSFEAAVGVSSDQAPYEISYLVAAGPTSAVGSSAELQVAQSTTICLLNRADGAPLTQSVLVG